MKKTVQVVMLPSTNVEEYSTPLTLSTTKEQVRVVNLNQVILNKKTGKLSVNKNSRWSATCDLNGEYDDLSSQHLYLTIDSEIKSGDVVYNPLYQSIIISKGEIFDLNFNKKVIASTNPTLNLPLIPISFVEIYVKSDGKIGNVQVEYNVPTYEDWYNNGCSPVFPKLKLRKDNSVIIHRTEDLVIKLNPVEIRSGFDRQKQAESLILQLPKDHDGRNTWLLNYGTGEEAVKMREDKGLQFDNVTKSCETIN